MKLYTKEKRNKLSAAWLGFDGDRLYLNLGQAWALSKHQTGCLKRIVLDGNLFIEVYIDKRSYFIIV